jgi:hypothetical protein
MKKEKNFKGCRHCTYTHTHTYIKMCCGDFSAEIAGFFSFCDFLIKKLSHNFLLCTAMEVGGEGGLRKLLHVCRYEKVPLRVVFSRFY